MLALNLLVLIAIFSAMMVFFLRFTLTLMGRMVGKRVDQLHREAQYLTETHDVPPTWPRERLSSMSLPRYRRYVRRRFRRLDNYFANAPVFDDRETRATVRSRLKAASDHLSSEEVWAALRDHD